jgi:hypothetical protein
MKKSKNNFKNIKRQWGLAKRLEHRNPKGKNKNK